MKNNETINCQLMFKDIAICDVIFKNGYFFRLKKVLNEDLLPTKYFLNQETSIALARWFSFRDLCYLRKTFTTNTSKEFSIISDNWMYIAPFDAYWLKFPDIHTSYEDIKLIPKDIYSYNLPNNAFYVSKGNDLYYREIYTADNVTARKLTQYPAKTIIDRKAARCFIEFEIPRGNYYILPINKSTKVTDILPIMEKTNCLSLLDQILHYIEYDSFTYIYYDESSNAVLFI